MLLSVLREFVLSLTSLTNFSFVGNRSLTSELVSDFCFLAAILRKIES